MEDGEGDWLAGTEFRVAHRPVNTSEFDDRKNLWRTDRLLCILGVRLEKRSWLYDSIVYSWGRRGLLSSSSIVQSQKLVRRNGVVWWRLSNPILSQSRSCPWTCPPRPAYSRRPRIGTQWHPWRCKILRLRAYPPTVPCSALPFSKSWKPGSTVAAASNWTTNHDGYFDVTWYTNRFWICLDTVSLLQILSTGRIMNLSGLLTWLGCLICVLLRGKCIRTTDSMIHMIQYLGVGLKLHAGYV